ncbi:MAG TPA: acyl-CoA synthetase, partial [Gammaproteobacteria bacterium]|nr:acyl-CoA synthetase [Gammaproteobacteria bacterium]
MLIWEDIKERVMFDINQYETLPQVLVARAAEAPDELSQRYKDRGIWKRLTWKDVFDNVRRLALGLSALGFQRGETLAIVGENTPENFWAEYAAMCLGGKVVSLYPDVTPEEMTYLLDDSDSVIVVAEDQEQVDKILEIKENIPKVRQVIYWDDKGMWSYNYDFLYQFKSIQEMGDELAGNSPTLFSDEIAKGRLDDIAVLTYTSGR